MYKQNLCNNHIQYIYFSLCCTINTSQNILNNVTNLSNKYFFHILKIINTNITIYTTCSVGIYKTTENRAIVNTSTGTVDEISAVFAETAAVSDSNTVPANFGECDNVVSSDEAATNVEEVNEDSDDVKESTVSEDTDAVADTLNFSDWFAELVDSLEELFDITDDISDSLEPTGEDTEAVSE